MEEQKENTTDIDSPDALLSHLIFPCLNNKDLVFSLSVNMGVNWQNVE